MEYHLGIILKIICKTKSLKNKFYTKQASIYLTKANAAMRKVGSENTKNQQLQAGMRVNHERFERKKFYRLKGYRTTKKPLFSSMD